MEKCAHFDYSRDVIVQKKLCVEERKKLKKNKNHYVFISSEVYVGCTESIIIYVLHRRNFFSPFFLNFSPSARRLSMCIETQKSAQHNPFFGDGSD